MAYRTATSGRPPPLPPLTPRSRRSCSLLLSPQIFRFSLQLLFFPSHIQGKSVFFSVPRQILPLEALVLSSLHYSVLTHSVSSVLHLQSLLLPSVFLQPQNKSLPSATTTSSHYNTPQSPGSICFLHTPFSLSLCNLTFFSIHPNSQRSSGPWSHTFSLLTSQSHL